MGELLVLLLEELIAQDLNLYPHLAQQLYAAPAHLGVGI